MGNEIRSANLKLTRWVLREVSLRSLLPTKLRRSRVVKVRGKLGSDSEELGDEPCFRNNVTLCYPSDSALADHVHGFYSFESSPSTLKGAVAFCQPGPLFDGSMILFNDIVEILALAKMNSAGGEYPRLSRLPLQPDRPGSYPR